MSENKKRGSTTDFFLKYVKKEKNLKELDNEKKEEFDIKKTKSMDYIAKIYNSVNKILDKMLKSRQSVLLVSLVLSLILFITLAGGDVVSTTTSGKVIKEVAVKVEGLKDGYEVSGIPTNVNIMLVGPSIDIYTAQLTKNYEVYADLSGYSEGVHTISLRTRNFSNDLKVSVVPETSSITISKTISKNFKLGYEFINQNELDEKYAVSMKELSKDTVKVEASKATLSKIDHVNALINVSDKIKSFTDTCEIKAYDAANNEIKCKITPNTVKATCRVDSYSKDVAVKPHFIGELKEGYEIKSYKLSPSTITIYGKRSDISDINSISCDVNITDLSGSTKLTSLTLENNDKISKKSKDTIDISLTIGKKGD